MDIRKLKPEPETNLPSLTNAKLEALIEEAVVDAYGDDEQKVGLLTMMQEHLALPFSVSILGVEATVVKVDMTRDGRIVAVCQRNGIGRELKFSICRCPSQFRQARNGLRHTAIGAEGFK